MPKYLLVPYIFVNLITLEFQLPTQFLCQFKALECSTFKVSWMIFSSQNHAYFQVHGRSEINGKN